jgi:putative ABC transport system permease protein
VSLRGSDGIARGQAALGSEVAHRLDLHPGDRIVVGGQSLVVNIAGGGQSITVATPLAHSVVGDNGWWLISAPAGDEKRRDLGQIFGDAVGLESAPGR